MIVNRRNIGICIAALLAVTSTSTSAGAAPYVGPIKLLSSNHFGREVNLSEVDKAGGPALEDVCLEPNGKAGVDTCQAGRESSIQGGFSYPRGVAVESDPSSPDYENIYVVDNVNNRVQEITPAGAFVSMFGWEVNETKDNEIKAKGATPTQAEREEGNICTSVSHDVCKAGIQGALAEQFSNNAFSIAVDRSTGNIYVEDASNSRIDEYTSAGHFILMIGKDVDETKEKESGASQAEKNVCTAISRDVCKSGVRGGPGSTENSTFNFTQGPGNIIAVGGPEDLLYVGGEHRVQEFEASSGAPKSEIQLTSIGAEVGNTVLALTVDENGVVYVTYQVSGVANTVYVFEGAHMREIKLRVPREAGGTVSGVAMAIDSTGQLAVSENESGTVSTWYGSLYGAATGKTISEFANPHDRALAFGVKSSEVDELYAAVFERQEVLAYTSVHIAELVTSTAGSKCVPGNEEVASSSVAFACTLAGEVNPENVEGTLVWFEWGETPGLGSKTPTQMIPNGEAPVPVDVALDRTLPPDETLYYRLGGNDNNVPSGPELITSEEASLKTPTAPPRIIGPPSTPFITSSSAVMFGEVNPEKATTSYRFQYAVETNECLTLAKCSTRAETANVESGAYGRVGVTNEIRDLQPDETILYRLVAENSDKQPAEYVEQQPVPGLEPGEGRFSTAPALEVHAETGEASLIGATSALISGVVDSDGRAATYAFELGECSSGNGQCGVVLSGPVAASTVASVETYALTGLQAGTEYTYRVKISSPGYGIAYGAYVRFTTIGLPSVISVPVEPPMLAVPTTKFPVTPSGGKPPNKCKRGSTRDKRGKCIKTRKKVKAGTRSAHRGRAPQTKK
jgi:hypothetical protein